jgi:hypothetical protein
MLNVLSQCDGSGFLREAAFLWKVQNTVDRESYINYGQELYICHSDLMGESRHLWRKR